MKKLVAIVLSLMISIVFVSVTAANGLDDQGNPNDPAVNERANACFDGGTLGTERCNTTDADEDGTLTQFDIDWMWRCGWFLIRFEEGMIDRDYVPEGCKTAPPIQVYFEESAPTPSPEATPELCAASIGERDVDPCSPPICITGIGERFDPCAPYIPPIDPCIINPYGPACPLEPCATSILPAYDPNQMTLVKLC